MNVGAAEILILAYMLAWIPLLVVAGMKGRWVWFVLGILFWLPALVGALLPARPDSQWAIRRRRRAGA